MKIACPSCSAKYSIADEKVQNRLAKIRCRKCGTTIVIDGKANPPTVQAAGASMSPQAASVSQAPSVGPSAATYTVDIAENDQRPMTVGEIVEAYNTGLITADTYVWQDGMADWTPLADVPEINDALHAAAAAASVPPAAAAVAASQPPINPTPGPEFSAAAEENSRAASRVDQRADLFGGIDKAGSEQDSSLAGGDSSSEAGVVTANTGARNESSVLFSLSALTGDETAGPPGPVPTGGGGATEDSGLIDLAALTAKAESADPSQSMDLGSAPIGAAPLGSPLGGAPLTGGTTSPLGAETTPPPASSSKNGFFIGGGIAVAAVVGGLVFLLKEEPPAGPAVVPTATVVITQTVTVPQPEPPKDEEGEEEEDDKAEATKTAQKSPKRTYQATPKPRKSPSSSSKSSSGSSKTKETSKSAEKPAPKPKKSKCNCPKGDLMCAMKCSTK